jgi:hypothetical protein
VRTAGQIGEENDHDDRRQQHGRRVRATERQLRQDDTEPDRRGQAVSTERDVQKCPNAWARDRQKGGTTRSADQVGWPKG